MDDRLEKLNDACPANYFDKENGILLYQGDCLEVLSVLAEVLPQSLNCIVTDPPYGIAYVSNHRTDKDILGQAIANDKNLDVLKIVVPMLDKLLAQNSAAYFFAHPNMIGENRLIFDPYWTYKNTLVWDKGDAGTFGDLEAAYSLNYESVFYYNKGRRKLNGSRPRTILRYDYNNPLIRDGSEVPYDEYLSVIENLLFELSEDKKEEVISLLPDDIVQLALARYPKSRLRKDWSARNDPVHPTVKPVNLMALLIKYSTNEGDLVIDPFMGSGPVGAACKKLGRKFIGIELHPKFFTTAVERVKHGDAFISKTPRPPEIQKDLF